VPLREKKTEKKAGHEGMEAKQKRKKGKK